MGQGNKDLLIRVGGDSTALRADMEQAARIMYDHGKKMQGIGEAMTKKLTKNVGLGMGAIAAFSINAESNFKKIEQKISGISEHTGLIKPAMELALNSVIGLSESYAGLSNNTKGWISMIGLAATAVGPAITAYGTLVQVLAGVKSFAVSEVPGIVAKLKTLATPFNLTVAAAAITALILLYKTLDKKMTETMRLRRDLSDAQTDAMKATAAETNTVQNLIDIVNDSNIGQDERLQAYNQLQAIIPNIEGAVLGEASSMKKLNEQVERYITMSQQRALAERLGAKMADAQIEIMEKQQKIDELRAKGGSGTVFGGGFITFRKNQDIKDAESDIKNLENVISGLDVAYKKASMSALQLNSAINSPINNPGKKGKGTKIKTEKDKTLDDYLRELDAMRVKALQLEMVLRSVWNFLHGIDSNKGTVDALDIKALSEKEFKMPEMTMELDMESAERTMKGFFRVATQDGERWVKDTENMWEGFAEKLEGMMGDVANSIANIFAGAAVDTLFNALAGPSEALRSLNEKLEENQRLRTDPTAPKAERLAAAERIKAIKEQIQLEKAKNNVLSQSSQLILDVAKAAIKAAFAEMIASAIAKESDKGLWGIVTAGIAVAGLISLFQSKVPKLAKGGSASGQTLAVVGDNPRASQGNPEVIGSLEVLDKKFRSSVSDMMRQIGGGAISTPSMQMAPIRINIGGKFTIENRDLVYVLEDAITNYFRTSGRKL